MQWGFIFPIRLFLLSVPSENLQLKVREQNEAWEDIVGEELIKIQLLVWVKGTFVRGAFLIQPNKSSIGWNSENSLCTCHISSLYKSRGSANVLDNRSPSCLYRHFPMFISCYTTLHNPPIWSTTWSNGGWCHHQFLLDWEDWVSSKRLKAHRRGLLAQEKCMLQVCPRGEPPPAALCWLLILLPGGGLCGSVSTH